MAKMVLPMELYHAARETCLRLYVANGGDARAKWNIRPYPGTAAIACNEGNAYRPPSFTLCMPSVSARRALAALESGPNRGLHRA